LKELVVASSLLALRPGYIIRPTLLAVAIAAGLVFSALTYADTPSQLIGKDLGQNRELLASAMHGRSYVVEVDRHGKITQVVDTGADGDAAEAQQMVNNRAVSAASLATPPAPETKHFSPVELAENFQGQAAIDYLGRDLPEIAASYGLTPEKLEETFLNNATVRIDRNNRLFYADNTAE
jgi:hypothetical protein